MPVAQSIEERLNVGCVIAPPSNVSSASGRSPVSGEIGGSDSHATLRQEARQIPVPPSVLPESVHDSERGCGLASTLPGVHVRVDGHGSAG
jgi:hypothetical protein